MHGELFSMAGPAVASHSTPERRQTSNSQNLLPLLGFLEEDIAQQMLSELPLVKGIVFLSLLESWNKTMLFLGKTRLSFRCCGCFLFMVSHPFSTWPCLRSIEERQRWGLHTAASVSPLPACRHDRLSPVFLPFKKPWCLPTLEKETHLTLEQVHGFSSSSLLATV